MKIIVTGCRGQLGTEILKQLREGRSEIGPIPEKLLNATVLPVDLPELDISNYRMVDEFIRRNRPDVIINCAAYTNADFQEQFLRQKHLQRHLQRMTMPSIMHLRFSSRIRLS